jgi:hypothetical protein
MKISLLFRFLFCAFIATGMSVSVSAQDALGRIIAAKVQGRVQKIAADGTTTPLKNGEQLTQKDTVITEKGASTVLVFGNGSTVRIGAESRLEIETFTMDNPNQPIADFSALKEEPSRSQTVLNLSYGEMVGEVKKLNRYSRHDLPDRLQAFSGRQSVLHDLHERRCGGDERCRGYRGHPR